MTTVIRFPENTDEHQNIVAALSDDEIRQALEQIYAAERALRVECVNRGIWWDFAAEELPK